MLLDFTFSDGCFKGVDSPEGGGVMVTSGGTGVRDLLRTNF
jgi:hypothetical protein